MNIHFIAIGGAIMHNLAIVLKRQGHVVSGSDDKIVDPAKTALENEGIMPQEIGFFDTRIHVGLDAVILGMHARLDNPELLKAQEMGIKIYSFPHFIYEVSKNKKRVVVAGSHGKTTITSMIMHVLKKRGFDFDYMVGAKVKGFETGVKLTDSAPLIILEGDEYLASPLHMESKFMFYHPHFVLISGIAWDHINVFPIYENYVNQFKKLAETIEDGGYFTWYKKDVELNKLFHENNTIRVSNESYESFDYVVDNYSTKILWNGKEFPVSVFGQHNIQNMTGAHNICRKLGIETTDFLEAISDFEGASNRLQLIGSSARTFIYKDFAHSPSKVKATIQAVREQYHDKQIVGIVELHTFSSLNKDFMKEYSESTLGLDVPVVFYDEESFKLKKMEMLDPQLVSDSFSDKRIRVITAVEYLQDFLVKQNWDNKVLLLMSSGNFAGLDLPFIYKTILS